MNQKKIKPEGAKALIIGIVKLIIMIALAVGTSMLLCFPVQWLWNWLVPGILGLRRISIAEAWGIVVLLQLMFPRSSGNGTE
jgi:hypothetical protein